MRKIRFHGRGVLGLLEGTVLLFLCFSVLVACSGEVYDPSAGTLYLEEGSDRGEPVTDAQTGSLLEIPSFDDPFADAAHILRAEFLNTGESDAILLQVGDVVILLDTGESDDYASIRGRMDASTTITSARRHRFCRISSWAPSICRITCGNRCFTAA